MRTKGFCSAKQRVASLRRWRRNKVDARVAIAVPKHGQINADFSRARLIQQPVGLLLLARTKNS